MIGAVACLSGEFAQPVSFLPASLAQPGTADADYRFASQGLCNALYHPMAETEGEGRLLSL